MEEPETITPEYEEMNKEHEITIKDAKLIIKINNDTITLILIKELSYYKYLIPYNKATTSDNQKRGIYLYYKNSFILWNMVSKKV